MHAIRPDRAVLLAALVASLFALLAVLAAAPLADLDFSGGSAPVSAQAPAAAPPAGEPVWVNDPLAPPSLLREAR
jgi:hypothetical protein